MNTQQALQLFIQCSDFTVSQLPEPARTATIEKMRAAYQVLAQAIAPKPVAPPRPAPIVNPATGDFPTEEPEVSDGNVA